MSDLTPATDLGKIPADMPQRPAVVADSKADGGHAYWYYCTAEDHPGAPRYSAQPLYVKPGDPSSRIFGVETDQGCPICPACQRETSCVPCGGPTMPPMAIVQYHQRFTQQQLMGGIGR